MLNEERIMVMINLAMLEDEYGILLEEGLPKRKKYVRSRMSVFFVWESLLYLLMCVGLFAGLFLANSFSMPENANTLIIILVVFYAAITYIGLSLIRHQSTKKYKRLKRRLSVYIEELDRLSELYEKDESDVIKE